MKILIGYDGSDCSRGAMTDLQKAGLFDDVEAIVLTAAHVYLNLPRSCFEPGDMAEAAQAVRRAHELGGQAMADAKERAEEGAARLCALFPSWKVSGEATSEPAHRGLMSRSEAWGADLIVVGSHGRSALARAVLGSVSQQVVHGAHCSVRIGRCNDNAASSASATAGAVKILLGVDGSPDSATAVSAVAGRQWPSGSEIRVISVIDVRVSVSYTGMDPLGGAWMDPSGLPTEASMSQDALRRVARELERPGIRVATNVLIGDPKHALVEEADAWKADCIFVGARWHGPMERIILGSVSASVAARAHCSVEIVRGS